jgi:cytidine deaminase
MEPKPLTQRDYACVRLAEKTAENAHSPYSQFKLGAVVISEAGHTYTGCNVENASYGLTICAERAAIFSGVAAEGRSFRIREIFVASLPQKHFPPCGACRQVISEFAGKDSTITFNYKGNVEKRLVSDILPFPFSCEDL